MSEYLAESRRIRAEQERAYAESLAADQAKEKAKVYAYILVYAYNIVQELIRTKKRGRACNLNWAEFLNCTKNRTSSQE